MHNNNEKKLKLKGFVNDETTFTFSTVSSLERSNILNLNINETDEFVKVNVDSMNDSHKFRDVFVNIGSILGKYCFSFFNTIFNIYYYIY